MKTPSLQQEILLMTNTRFASKNWCAKDPLEEDKNKAKEDILKEACWNGLLPLMLPEIYNPTEEKKLFLWEVDEADTFINIVLGEESGHVEKITSINPYSFLSHQLMS